MDEQAFYGKAASSRRTPKKAGRVNPAPTKTTGPHERWRLVLRAEGDFEIDHRVLGRNGFYVGNVQRGMRNHIELAANVEENHAVKRAVGRDDVGLEAERSEFVFDVLSLAVFGGQVAAGQSGKVARPGCCGAFWMSDTRGGLRDGQCADIGVLAIGIFDVEANGGKINVDRCVQIILEKDLHGENAGFVGIGFTKFLFCAAGVGVGIGGDRESLMRVFGKIARWGGRLRMRGRAGDERKGGNEQRNYFHAGDRCKGGAKRCGFVAAVKL